MGAGRGEAGAWLGHGVMCAWVLEQAWASFRTRAEVEAGFFLFLS
jgi:hypothetical protein